MAIAPGPEIADHIIGGNHVRKTIRAGRMMPSEDDLAARDHRRLDVAIIGAGAIGLAIAYSLRTMDGNCRIAVIEKDPSYALASTPRASGGVRRLFTLPENIELSNHSIPIYERFHELMAVNGDIADIGFKKGGYLFIVPPRGVATLARNFERQKKHKVNVEWLVPDKLKERFPSMRVDDLGAGVQSHNDGWLDPYAVLMASRRKVKSLGVEFIDDEVMAIEREDRLVRSLTLKSGRKLKPDHAVNATGAWAQQICAMIGMKVPITPLRRYEHYFECEERIEPLPYLKDVDRLAFRPEGKGIRAACRPCASRAASTSRSTMTISMTWSGRLSPIASRNSRRRNARRRCPAFMIKMTSMAMRSSAPGTASARISTWRPDFRAMVSCMRRLAAFRSPSTFSRAASKRSILPASAGRACRMADRCPKKGLFDRVAAHARGAP